MSKGGKCQVCGCTEKAKWKCKPAGFRYCDGHKRNDSKEETFERIKR